MTRYRVMAGTEARPTGYKASSALLSADQARFLGAKAIIEIDYFFERGLMPPEKPWRHRRLAGADSLPGCDHNIRIILL